MKIGYLGATQTKQSLDKVMAYYRYIHFGRKVLLTGWEEKYSFTILTSNEKYITNSNTEQST